MCGRAQDIDHHGTASKVDETLRTGRHKANVQITEVGDEIPHVSIRERRAIVGKHQPVGESIGPDPGTQRTQRRRQPLEVVLAGCWRDVEVRGDHVGAVEGSSQTTDHHVVDAMLGQHGKNSLRSKLNHETRSSLLVPQERTDRSSRPWSIVRRSRDRGFAEGSPTRPDPGCRVRW